MTDEQTVETIVLRILGMCPTLNQEMQARITYEVLGDTPNCREASRRVAVWKQTGKMPAPDPEWLTHAR